MHETFEYWSDGRTLHGVRELKTSNRDDFEIRQRFDKRGDDKRKGCAVLLPTLHPARGRELKSKTHPIQVDLPASHLSWGAVIEIADTLHQSPHPSRTPYGERELQWFILVFALPSPGSHPS